MNKSVLYLELDYGGEFYGYGFVEKEEMNVVGWKKVCKGVYWYEVSRNYLGKLYVFEDSYLYNSLRYRIENEEDNDINEIEMGMIYYELGIENMNYDEFCDMKKSYKEWLESKKDVE